jgi:uncharacterized membrane protein
MRKDRIISFIIISISLVVFFFHVFFPSGEKTEKKISLYDEQNFSYYEETSFYKGRVLKVEHEDIDYQSADQKLKVEILNNDFIGKEFLVDNRAVLDIDKSHIFKEGDDVLLTTTDKRTFYVGDHLRQNGLILALFIFIATILYFGRMRGIGAIFGLGFSFLVLIYYIIPRIISGEEIIKVTLIGILIISGVSIFLAHGISRKANVIWLSAVVTLLVAIFLSHFFVETTNLFGRGSDVDFSFSFGEYSHISLKGLLFAGLVIGVFGVITDVVSTQTAAIWQIKRANPNLGRKELYQRGILVGREHIASLVNTLILVYVGASLPLFIIVMGIEHTPLWVMINGEIIAEEVIRAITGSVSLILGVPISSFFASYFVSKQKEEALENL